MFLKEFSSAIQQSISAAKINACHQLMKTAQENLSETNFHISGHNMNPGSAYGEAAYGLLEEEANAYKKVLNEFVGTH